METPTDHKLYFAKVLELSILFCEKCHVNAAAVSCSFFTFLQFSRYLGAWTHLSVSVSVFVWPSLRPSFFLSLISKENKTESQPFPSASRSSVQEAWGAGAEAAVQTAWCPEGTEHDAGQKTFSAAETVRKHFLLEAVWNWNARCNLLLHVYSFIFVLVLHMSICTVFSKAELHSQQCTQKTYLDLHWMCTCVWLTLLLVLGPCRLLPSVQQAQRDARQATFLFRRGLKVHKPMLCVAVLKVLSCSQCVRIIAMYWWDGMLQIVIMWRLGLPDVTAAAVCVKI